MLSDLAEWRRPWIAAILTGREIRLSVFGEWIQSAIMRLQFLGTGEFQSNERRHTDSLLLPEIGVALNAGSGFFRVIPNAELSEDLTETEF